MSLTDTCGLVPLQVWERVVMRVALLWLHRRKCMVESLIDCKYCVRHEILKYF